MKKEARVRAQQALLARLDEERKARAAQAPKPQHRNLNQSVRANVDESKSKIKKAVVEAPDEHQSLDSSPGRRRNVATGASGSPGRRREVATAGSDVSEVSPVNNKDIERQRARGLGQPREQHGEQQPQPMKAACGDDKGLRERQRRLMREKYNPSPKSSHASHSVPPEIDVYNNTSSISPRAPPGTAPKPEAFDTPRRRVANHVAADCAYTVDVSAAPFKFIGEDDGESSEASSPSISASACSSPGHRGPRRERGQRREAPWEKDHSSNHKSSYRAVEESQPTHVKRYTYAESEYLTTERGYSYRETSQIRGADCVHTSIGTGGGSYEGVGESASPTADSTLDADGYGYSSRHRREGTQHRSPAPNASPKIAKTAKQQERRPRKRRVVRVPIVSSSVAYLSLSVCASHQPDHHYLNYL